MSSEELFNRWYNESWKYGSSTDQLRARRAWVVARASLGELVADLVRTRASDAHLEAACAFLVEAGNFFKEHPDLEIVALDEGTGLVKRS